MFHKKLILIFFKFLIKFSIFIFFLSLERFYSKIFVKRRGKQVIHSLLGWRVVEDAELASRR